MRRIAIITLVVFGFTATVAVAANVHFKSGSPTFINNGLTLTVNGTLAGIGNKDLTITVTATGTATTVGINPGGHTVPGHPATVTETRTLPISASEVKNGEVFFSVTTPPPATPTAKQAGFPNNNWTVIVTSVSFTSVTITVKQGGKTVLNQTFTP